MEKTERVGVSLYPEVVLNQPQSRMQRQILADFPGGEMILPWLKDQGVNSIELRMLSGKLPPKDYAFFLEKVWHAGMQITLHGVMPESAPEQYVALYADVLRRVCEQQESTVFTVHSMKENAQTRGCLLALSHALQPYSGIRLSLENQRIHDSAYAHYSVSGVAQNAAACHAGITWDMGHYAFNIQKEICSVPGKSLLSQVIHTHIHSLDAQGNTHHHLTEQPVKEYIEALRDSGYKGIYNLELFAKTYPETASPKQTLEEAICLLRSLLK